MTTFRDLLLENPDTVSYKRKLYNYGTPANRCAFFVYKDGKSGRETMFGYSDNKKQFYSDDSDVLKDLKELEDGEQIKYSDDFQDEEESKYWAQQGIKKLKSGNNGGGHLALENILKGTGRMNKYSDPIMKGRIFEVDDTDSKPPENLDIKFESTIPSGKAIIVTFWDYNKNKVIPYKDQYEKVIEFNGYDPKECLYETGNKMMSYDTLYSKEEPEKKTPPPAPKPSDESEAAKYFKTGDKVKIKGMNISADVLSVKNNLVSLVVTDSDISTVPVGSKFTYPYFALEPDTSAAKVSLEKVIDDKTQEYIDKKGKIHTTGATLTPSEKEALEDEADGLEVEIKILNDLLNSGEKYYTDNIKQVVDTSVARKLHYLKKQKQDRYNLITQAEKQYGMPIAKIRQKYRGVPLDQLVKKESIYKKLLKALLG